MAAGGGRDDPLISLSYVQDTFLPAMRRTIAAIVSGRAAPGQNMQTRSGPVAVSAGGSVSLGPGHSFVLTSGSAGLRIDRGSVVNVSVGAEVGNGGVTLYQRYVVCEESAATLDITADAALYAAGAVSVTQGDGRVSPFSDVSRGSWYYDDVINAYERGLVDGMTASTFDPGGTLTIAQCVKLAACMHQLYTDGAVTLTPDTVGAWYRSYVDYALENGIIAGEFDGYDAIIDRRRFVYVFYSALPPSEYAVLNDIPDGAVPDVAMTDPCAGEIYSFYRAGILAGYTDTPGYAAHAFAADSTITRAEVAAIMNRMFDARTRISFDIS